MYRVQYGIFSALLLAASSVQMQFFSGVELKKSPTSLKDQNNISSESSSLVLKTSFLHSCSELRLRIVENRLQKS